MSVHNATEKSIPDAYVLCQGVYVIVLQQAKGWRFKPRLKGLRATKSADADWDVPNLRRQVLWPQPVRRGFNCQPGAFQFLEGKRGDRQKRRVRLG